jgi:pimeloyl-ACP methyl ester carboxylesterase
MARPIKGSPFRIEIAEPILDDLRARLRDNRWPVEPDAPAWAFGTSLGYMREVVDYWRDRYDWRAAEAELNRFEQFLVPVGDLNIHVIVEEGSGPDPLPVILTHGWPGCVVEFLDVIEPLAHPERFGGRAEDGVTVIAPSLPGYGFSDPPKAPITPREVAALWHELATQGLGLQRYGAHGSDWGAAVTSWLAFDHPEALTGIHLTMSILSAAPAPDDRPFDAEELAFLERMGARMVNETGYQAIQGTKPQTLAYGLTNSPVGLAAWVLEKFHSWSAAAGTNAPPPMSLDRLLTNIMLYWLNGPNAASWLYVAMVSGTAFRLPPGGRIETPTALCMFPHDIAAPSPEQWGRRSYNVVERRVAEHGGHFPGLDAPGILTESIRGFFAGRRRGENQ